MISVSKIESFELFLELRNNWEEVYRQDNEADYFLSWSWLSQLFGRRDECVFILAVKISDSSSRYCAFFPLRREVRLSDSKHRFFDCFCMAGNYWADSTGLICDPAVESLAIPALAHALKTLSWQRVLFESLQISPRRKAWLIEPFSKQNYSVRSNSHTDNHGKTNLACSPFVDLPETFDLYLEHKTSANTRQKIKRIRRKIESDPDLSVELTDSRSIEQYLDFFEQAWIDSWKDIKGRSAERLARRYSTFMREGFHSGDMIIPVLFSEDKPVGGLAIYKDPIKKQLLFFVAGRDPGFDKIPSGLALHAFCIEWAIDNKYTRYSLLRGDEPYKYSLGATDALLCNIVIYKRVLPAETQLLNQAVKKPALKLLNRQIENRSEAEIHNLYSQLLESWPGDASVLSNYADWLESVESIDHAIDIRQYLTEKHHLIDENQSAIFAEVPINMAPYREKQRWLDDLEKKTQTLPVGGSLSIEGLEIELTSGDSGYFKWLKSYLCPLVVETATQQPNGDGFESGSADKLEPLRGGEARYRLVCMLENDLVLRLMRLVNTRAFEVKSLKLDGRRIDRVYLSSELIVDINKHEGVVWVSDISSRQLTLLMSSRVAWPSLEVSRTARALLIAYLQQEGWIFLHSGAARVNGKNYLVIGDEGQGKTSLLLALMSGGCQYISNERVFVRKNGSKIEALSFPMPVAIGIGAAQQYPEIMQYLSNPEYCRYPQRRMNINKLRSTPESKWASLSDKVQLLVPELLEVFGDEKAVRAGQISGVIVPSIVKDGETGYQDKANLLDKKKMQRIVRRNYISIDYDTRYSAWLPLAFDAPLSEPIDELIDSICTLPGIRFKYCASMERKQAVAEYSTIIQRALHQSN